MSRRKDVIHTRSWLVLGEDLTCLVGLGWVEDESASGEDDWGYILCLEL